MIYVKNNIENELEHKPSDANGFPYIENNNIPNKETRYNFSAELFSSSFEKYSLAEQVPLNTKRAWVLRTSLYSAIDHVKQIIEIGILRWLKIEEIYK